MGSPTIWSSGRYDAVGERIAPIASQLVDAAERRRALGGTDVIDLACGTGSAALAAAARGARVTGVDYTPQLIAIAQDRDGADAVTWRIGDASDTGLPAGTFDVAVSNMGIIFVDPGRQVPELVRLLKPAGVLAFSAWVRNVDNPLFDPVVAVLGAPAKAAFSPDQWGDTATLTERLDAYFDEIDVQRGEHRWEFESMDAALHWLRAESPVHVATFSRADAAQQELLTTEFEKALRPHRQRSGAIAFTSPYVVVSARKSHSA
ncbi:class I SAM-dependent methyltransferase [Mycolicibacterium sp. BiH015]|uniref:class I SAM-dependent methyltransferase n=1 Tax=Mycolicibacterium sp. BiH015 TaxID=3018808 RepID=UPI0022DFFBC7|nr:class I SAM-dependent methyltransferase [Mycolicibacterium sp. BiH015]MDA2894415.1 class I SAM-dependent methyltransferase [Mycolicibacterium sp. BiH015]